MTQEQGITRELSLGEVVSKTFELYRRDFVKYLVIFLVVEAVIGVVTALVTRAFILPTLPANPTAQDILNWLPGFFGTLFYLLTLSILVTVVLYPIAGGSAIRIASQEIEKGQVSLGASIRFAVSKLVWLWALTIVVGIIVGLGFIALIVPGIILAIMFCLALPALLVENTGVLESMGRSRKLVGGRWLKTFALGIVFVIIVAIASVIVNAISAPFGGASTIVSSILSAFYEPLFPIVLTVYYFSNVARLASPQVTQAMMAPAASVQLETKFCPKCGTQMPSWASVCPKCGTQQPV
jgi:ribosomal protein L40E